MPLFDAHCHLQDERLLPRLDLLLDEAAARGVARLMCCGAEEADWDAVEAIARRHPAVAVSFGLHPWYAARRSTGWLDRLRALLRARPAAAVGEAGLDHAIRDLHEADQWTVLRDQWRLATELGRPLSLHCRRAWGALAQAVAQPDFPRPFVIHSYSGAAELVPSLAARGAFFSFSGSITRPRNRRARAAAVLVPPDRLLIETDAPDLMPFRPADSAPAPALLSDGPNVPANLTVVRDALASLRGMPPDELAELTFANASRVFPHAGSSTP